MEIYAVLNTQGMGIKKCCGSCMHKRVTDEGLRLCRKHRMYVYKTNCCKDWRMDRRLDRPVVRWGKLKSSEYLKYVAKIRIMENQRIREAEAKGFTLTMLKIETIQKRYKKLHGDIFMNF
jgi:hypothetical protein